MTQRLKIEELSPDTDLQERFRELDANQNGVIQRREVDSDRDGYLDVNPTTGAWPKYIFRRVENALFSQRLLSATHAHPPVFKVTLNNAEQTVLNIRPLDDFDPQVQAGTRLDLRTMGLGSLEAGRAMLNLEASLQADDPHTPANEGIDHIAQYLENEYFPAHPEMLQQLGIRDIYHLTPRQAVLLAASIPIERIEYSLPQTYGNLLEQIRSRELLLNDSTAIEQLFRWGPNGDGNGVCRNYSEIARGILDALKRLQDPSTSQLNTTYAILHRSPGFGEKGKIVPGWVDFHVWNSYLTVTRDGILAVVLDSTWADESSLNQDPARLGARDVKLDYTAERFLALVDTLNERGMIDSDEFFNVLVAAYENTPDPIFPHIDSSNVEREFRSPPHAYLIRSELLQLLVTPPEKKDLSQEELSYFISSYYQALANHLHQLGEAQPFLSKRGFERDMLIPFLTNLTGLLVLCQSLPESSEDKSIYLRRCDELLGRAEKDLNYRDLLEQQEALSTFFADTPHHSTRAILENHPDWIAFRKNCPCEIELSSVLELDNAQWTAARDGAKQYFAQVDLSLVRYKKIVLDSRDNTNNYLEPHIDIQHFIDHDSDTIDALLSQYDPNRYSQLLERQEIERRYHELEEGFPLFHVENFYEEDVPLAGALIEAITQALHLLKDEHTLGYWPFTLELRSREKYDPPAPYLLTQKGVLTLFLESSPRDAKTAMIEAMRLYRQFRDIYYGLQFGDGRGTGIVFRPYSEWKPLTPKTLERLASIQQLTAPLWNRFFLFVPFPTVNILVQDTALIIDIPIGGEYDRPNRHYSSAPFTPKNTAAFLQELNRFAGEAGEKESLQR